MFRHYPLILSDIVMNILPSYTNISKAAFGNKIYIKMFHNVNFITKSFIRKAFITWECIDYKLPQVGTTVSKHVGV